MINYLYIYIKQKRLKNPFAMRLKFIFILVSLVPYLGTRAQTPITVLNDSLKIGNSNLPAISVTIPEADYDKVLKAWIKELQTGTKSKVVTDNGEMSIFGARIKAVSTDPVNVYSILKKFDLMLQLVVSFELKKDLYIESTGGAAEYAKATNYLKEFSKTQYIAVAKQEADLEQKKLRDLEKELASLQKEKSKKLQKSIQSANSSILREQENITVQKNELSLVTSTLDAQNQELLAMQEDNPLRKEKAQSVKDLEKRRKKAVNSIESSEKKIKRAKSSIERAEAEIPRNERMQDKVKEQIRLQEAVYRQYDEKLKKIRSY